ncbi:RNA-binding protein 28 isoform X1 [Brassica rapa]|uniref:RNA-binding protein 28 isoform X1 n=1 Tax=Brassica campestris TaxID=3711 RepID=UPI00142E6FE3|nr:RNA-binding protein 28 isoform X1 [Brassica rapa]
MGKNTKKERKDGEEKSQHSAATVCVSGLPYSFTNAQLEEAFSDVGPVRLCFMVTNKGSNEHRGFAFVKFALPEDANRAIELKNGSTVGGRRITVKQATHRPSLKERRTKAAQGVSLPDSSQAESDDNKDSLVPETVTETETDKQGISLPRFGLRVFSWFSLVSFINTFVFAASVPPPEKKIEKPLERKKPTKPAKLLVDLADKETCSDKQRVARTVIFGGLVNAEMAEAVHSRVKKIGTVCSVRYPLPKEELQQNGLTQDGCRAEASAVLFTSVKSACAAVATLHQTEIKGNLIWARQLGGEGSKAQKWKLIIRNLPFKAKPSEIKEVFSAVGFVWDVFVPKNIETGLPKGFAFVKFTCKRDAENAIQKFNGHMFSKRPIAVDWAVPKNLYNGAADAATAPEDGEKDGSDGDSDNSSVDLEEVDDAVESHQSSGDDTDNDEEDGSNKPSESDALVKDAETDVNFEEEADVARKVLKNLLGSSKVTIASQGGETEESDINILEDSSTKPVVESSGVSEPLKSSKTKEAAPKETQENDDFKRTVFISNIPFDVSKEEVTQRFTAFGQVESLFLVLHPVTKRPKGTAFLKFKTADASDAAISAASSASGVGVLLKGRQLSVMRAVDKKSAKDIGLEKTKEKNIDHRNLYLAKEGQILEGTPAAEGVSAEDMDRRRRLHENKMKKLQSPNFHVSKTRIVIYNLPKSMDEKQLQKLLVDAVTSRATKQKPTIRQIKFLQNEKKGKVDTKNYSRGVAFVEFTEPDHALVALRVLNNNPETFGPQHRPVIEFAVDNVQKLKVHKANQQQQRNRYNESREQRENGEAQGEDNHPGNDLKRRTRDGDNTGSVEENANGYKKRKPMRPREQRREESKPEEKSSLSVKEDARNKRPTRAQENTKEPASNQKGQWKKRQQDASEKPDEKKISKDVSDAPRKRKFEEVRGGDNVNGQRKRKNQNERKKKQGGPPEVVDKLDMLIEQYRSKFTQSSTKTGPQKQSSGQVRRWFQS